MGAFLSMPLQNRVDPFGNIHAVAARGTMMGNRGGRIHDPAAQTLNRRYASKRWICCVCEFKDRKLEVMGRGYTQLFFLDEVTAFAAGHRPCAECRRADFVRFTEAWREAFGVTLRRIADEMDVVLHGERCVSGEGRSPILIDWSEAPPPLTPSHRGEGDKNARKIPSPLWGGAGVGAPRTELSHAFALPNGTMIAQGGQAFAVRNGCFLPWSFDGYGPPSPVSGEMTLLTPPSIVKIFKTGYAPAFHPSADL